MLSAGLPFFVKPTLSIERCFPLTGDLVVYDIEFLVGLILRLKQHINQTE